MESTRLRPATVADLEAINGIYNHYVLTSTSTWQIEPESAGARLEWFLQRDHSLHPVQVVECGGQIAGWGSLSPFGKRGGFRHTVENSIYIHGNFQRRGLGRRLLLDQIGQATAAGHHSIIAAISGEQSASLALHRAHGFAEAGRLIQAGWKFDQWLDLVYLQKIL